MCFNRFYPANDSRGKRPVFAIIHGGYWRHKYNIDNSLVDKLSSLITTNGYHSYVIEYRRVNPDEPLVSDGGWPNSNQDIIAALQFLYSQTSLESIVDYNKVVVIGHSAGSINISVKSCDLMSIA